MDTTDHSLVFTDPTELVVWKNLRRYCNVNGNWSLCSSGILVHCKTDFQVTSQMAPDSLQSSIL